VFEARRLKLTMPASVAASALAVPYSRVREIAETAMRMDGVYKLYFGESNLPTPAFIKQAAQDALADGYTYYTENAGLLSLRQALARYSFELHGVELDPTSEIAVTASGVQGLSVCLRCLVDPGDEALVLTPAWPNGAAILQMSHAVVKEIPQPFVNGAYAINFDALEAAVTSRTRVLLYTSPSNPLGWVATERDQERLLEFSRRHNLWLAADEVYERLYYSGPLSEGPVASPSILRKCTRDDAVVVIQSFSKAWCMTGWRLGWLTGHRDLIARASQLNEFMVSCPVAFVQKAGEAALAHGESSLREMSARLRANRDLCVTALGTMPGVTVPIPDGAFYLFPRIEGLDDSFAFSKRLLEETKVGLAPGVAFGAGGEGSVRLCYASDPETLRVALTRLKDYLELVF
jgi:aspartate/methionine/tyrosine aminotransferase